MNNHKMIQASYTVNNRELCHQGTQRLENGIYQALLAKLTDSLCYQCMKTTKEEYCTTYSIDLVVATPDEFHRLVQEEAMKLYSRMQ